MTIEEFKKDLEHLDLQDIANVVKNEKVEITITAEPERYKIQINPWKPFEYTWPINHVQSAEGTCQ